MADDMLVLARPRRCNILLRELSDKIPAYKADFDLSFIRDNKTECLHRIEVASRQALQAGVMHCINPLDDNTEIYEHQTLADIECQEDNSDHPTDWIVPSTSLSLPLRTSQVMQSKIPLISFSYGNNGIEVSETYSSGEIDSKTEDALEDIFTRVLSIEKSAYIPPFNLPKNKSGENPIEVNLYSPEDNLSVTGAHDAISAYVNNYTPWASSRVIIERPLSESRLKEILEEVLNPQPSPKIKIHPAIKAKAGGFPKLSE